MNFNSASPRTQTFSRLPLCPGSREPSLDVLRYFRQGGRLVRHQFAVLFHGSGASTPARLMTVVSSTGQPIVQYLYSSTAQ